MRQVRLGYCLPVPTVCYSLVLEEFLLYLSLGFHHIADPQACDHLLFIVTLCAAYPLLAWRQVLVLITAFTIGHSLTLALSALHLVNLPSKWVEILIPITILLSSLFNVLGGVAPAKQRVFSAKIGSRYLLALLFGLIHGLGFSSFFRALMGEATNITWPLFSFNIGIELGQILIVMLFFLLFMVLFRLKPFPHRDWNIFISGAGAGGSVLLLLGLLGG